MAELVKKPLIIHCVRAFNELLAIQKILKPKVPMIVHGFNKNIETATALIKNGTYLSFGVAILESEKLAEVLRNISINQVFFESDDSDISVEIIYKKAAGILNLPIEKLEENIYDNYLGLFI